MPRTTQSSCSESSCQSLKNGWSFDSDMGHLEVSSSRSLVCKGQEVHAALNTVSVTSVSADISATNVARVVFVCGERAVVSTKSEMSYP